jgi:hypothetical protein
MLDLFGSMHFRCDHTRFCLLSFVLPKTQTSTTLAFWPEVDGNEYINVLPTLELLRCFPSLQPTALAYKSSSTSSSLARGITLFCILENPRAINSA